MSPKPVDLDRALETLRAERPDPAATERARAALREPLPLPPGRGRGGVPPRKSLARPLALAMIATALSVVLVMPRSKAGSAWAQTLAATLDAPASHAVSRWSNGRLGSETWRSGTKRATVLYRENGDVQMELRTDGKRTLDYFNWSKRAGRPAPNERRWAVASNGSLLPFGRFEIPLGPASVLLASPDVQVVGHEPATAGRPETYHLRHTIRFAERANSKPVVRELDAEVDPATHRVAALVLQLTVKGRAESVRTVIDYPTTIPASIFAPSVQSARGVEVYDVDAQTNAVRRDLRQGLGRSGPVILRVVLLDAQGELWVYWTGARTGHPFDVPGVGFSPGAALVGKGDLSGMARIAISPIGPIIDLNVPYRGGIARFKGVPVRRIGFINPFQAVLMTSQTRRQ